MCTVYCQLRRNYSVYCDIDLVQVQKHNHNNIVRTHACVLFTVHCVLPTVCIGYRPCPRCSSSRKTCTCGSIHRPRGAREVFRYARAGLSTG